MNQVLPIGGPGAALTARQQAEILFRLTGQKENLLAVPVALMDGIIGILDFLAKFFPAQLEVRLFLGGGCLRCASTLLSLLMGAAVMVCARCALVAVPHNTQVGQGQPDHIDSSYQDASLTAQQYSTAGR